MQTACKRRASSSAGRGCDASALPGVAPGPTADWFILSLVAKVVFFRDSRAGSRHGRPPSFFPGLTLWLTLLGGEAASPLSRVSKPLKASSRE